MAGRRAAPRKKAQKAEARKELRSARLSAVPQVVNAEKLKSVHQRLDRVRVLKNRMSAHVHQNLTTLFKAPVDFKASYTLFNGSSVLNAWETQTLFHSICGDYERAWDRRVQARPIFVQVGFSAGRYKRSVTRTVEGVTQLLYRSGAPKPTDFTLHRTQTDLTRAAAYLSQVQDLGNFDSTHVKNDDLRATLTRLKAEPDKWERLCAFVRARRARMLVRMKLHHYRTGTHAIHPYIGSSGLVLDESNGKYQYFLKIRNTDKKKDGHVYLPLLVDRKRIDPAALRSEAAFLLKASGRKVHIILTYEANVPTFRERNRSLGIDANTKHNLMQDSEGRAYDYDRLYLDSLLALLQKLDKTGPRNLGYRDRGRLRKLVLRNEWKLKTMLSRWVDGWAEEGITDIVLEDLSMSKDATFIRHDLHDVKYSRLLRLLRLSSLKTWLASMCEKRHIRVHTTHAAYSSQECPECHTIDRDNRKTQEEFECVCCGREANADTNSALNLDRRLTDDVLREVLHSVDAHGRLSPKPMRYKAVKAVLLERWRPATDGLTEPLTSVTGGSTAPSKDGASREASAR